MYLTSVSVLLIIGCGVKAGSLFFQPCSLSDPKLNECALKNAKEALPNIIKGIKAFKIPNLSPARVSQVIIDGQNLKMKFTDISSNVLSDSTITKVNIDDKAKKWSFTIKADTFDLAGNYEIKGQILVLAISGQGLTNVTYTKPVYTYTMTYKDVEKNGNSYLDFVSSEGKLEFERTYYKFDNLFGGDSRLGDEMNAFLNENWEAFEVELHPVVVKTLGGIVDNIFKNIFAKVPKNEIYLP